MKYLVSVRIVDRFFVVLTTVGNAGLGTDSHGDGGNEEASELHLEDWLKGIY